MIMIDIILLCQMNIYLYGKIGHYSIEEYVDKKQEVTSYGSYKKKSNDIEFKSILLHLNSSYCYISNDETSIVHT
jgi:hypothetical protein